MDHDVAFTDLEVCVFASLVTCVVLQRLPRAVVFVVCLPFSKNTAVIPLLSSVVQDESLVFGRVPIALCLAPSVSIVPC